MNFSDIALCKKRSSIHEKVYTHQSSGEVFQVNRKSRFDSTSSGYNGFRFEDTFHHAERVVNGSLHFIAIEIIWSSQNNRTGCSLFWSNVKNILFSPKITTLSITNKRRKIKENYPLMKINSSSQTNSCTTSAASPKNEASK